MLNYLKTIPFLIVAALFLHQCLGKTPPIWPSQFEQSFSETFTYPFFGSTETKGKFFYDFTNRRYRIDRENGKWDRYCGTAFKFKDTPCSHIVVDEKRYLYYPEEQYCCYCCGSEDGCGIIKRDWAYNATFVELIDQKDKTGQEIKLEKWKKEGFQHNYLLVTADEERIMYKIEQEPNDSQTFDIESFNEGITNPKYLTLPDVCKQADTCSLLSTCTVARNF